MFSFFSTTICIYSSFPHTRYNMPFSQCHHHYLKTRNFESTPTTFAVIVSFFSFTYCSPRVAFFGSNARCVLYLYLYIGSNILYIYISYTRLRAMYINSIQYSLYTCGGYYDGPLKSAGINDHRYVV